LKKIIVTKKIVVKIIMTNFEVGKEEKREGTEKKKKKT
jgi:hypothetical protein